MSGEFIFVPIGIALLGFQFYRAVRGPLAMSTEELEVVANYYEEIYRHAPVRINILNIRARRRSYEIFEPYDSQFLAGSGE